MKYEEVIVETDEKHIGTITLNRPKHLNTFSSKMAEELSDALIALDANKTVRAILLKGAGKAFCAGIDVNELSNKTAMEYRNYMALRRPMAWALLPQRISLLPRRMPAWDLQQSTWG